MWGDTNRVVDETAVKTLQEITKTPLDSLVSVTQNGVRDVKPVTKALRLSPLVAIGLAAKDANDGYAETSNYIQHPTTRDQIAGAIANASTGLTLGLVPQREATLGLASLLGTKPREASAIAEELQNEVNKQYLEGVRANVLKGLASTKG